MKLKDLLNLNIDTNPEAGSPEAGSPEGGSPEGGSPEAGSLEAGSPEGGSPEGGSPEGGSPEGGSPEGGSPEYLTKAEFESILKTELSELVKDLQAANRAKAAEGSGQGAETFEELLKKHYES